MSSLTSSFSRNGRRLLLSKNINLSSRFLTCRSFSAPRSIHCVSAIQQTSPSTQPSPFMATQPNNRVSTIPFASLPISATLYRPTNIASIHTLSLFRREDSPTQCVTKNLTQTRGMASKRHKRVIKMAKGYRGRANRTFRAAIRRVEKGLQYAYRDRKVKKRNMRKLWIERINAGVRQHGLRYSAFINLLNKGENENVKIKLNRKMLANLASQEPFSFKSVVDVVKMGDGK